ncbi:UNVERIFIED_CONTAM: hypothetical protein PYX00_011364 [Menopon gallinae]|uniref:NADP-dependent oxidoreductase domain-containing protein n=1 Tax=Menopon gallinae TaxID=328185 RepID=A0AAW2H7E7_9NEOP
MAINKKFTLNSGYEMPAVGLGTWRIVGQEDVRSALRSAVSVGYRHIDTAYIYKNEQDIGAALAELFSEGCVRREDVFVTSKMWCTQHRDPEKALDSSLRRLGLKYLDLYLIHYPVTIKTDENGDEVLDESGKQVIEEFDAVGLWRKMEDLLATGKVRSIGVSNFGVHNLGKVLGSCSTRPAAAQFEVHPYLKQKELLRLCRENGILAISFSSLGSAEGYSKDAPSLRKDETITSIGKRYGKSVPQVILSYLVQQDIAVIPKSKDPNHQRENRELFELKEEDIREIDNISICHRFVKPEYLGKDAFK